MQKEEDIASRERMATPGRGGLPIQGKRELGKSKGGRQSSCKYHVGRPQSKVSGCSQANMGVSYLGKDKPHSVPKVGAVFRSLAKSRYSGKREDIKQRSFLSSFYSTKRHKQAPSNYRSFLFKQKHKESRSEDARPQFNSQIDRTRYVGSKIRFKGR